MHQNRTSPFASDFHRRRGYRREFGSEDHFYRFLRRRNRGSLAIFFAEEIAHLGAPSPSIWGSGRNRHRSRRESRDFGALRVSPQRNPTARPPLSRHRASLYPIALDFSVSRGIALCHPNSPPIATKAGHREGVSQLKLPSGGYRAIGGYRSYSIANRGLMGH